MATIDYAFNLLKFRANKSAYTGTISSSDFNLVWPDAEIRYFLKLFGNQNEYQVGNPIPRIAYPITTKVSTSLAKFGTPPVAITIDNTGRWSKDELIFFIDSISHTVNGISRPIERVEKMQLSDRLASYYESPDTNFPIFVEYNDYIQFYPIALGTATITTLNAPPKSFWGSTLNGGVATYNTLVVGTGYTDGIYPSVNLTGGAGNSAVATISISGGIVTDVKITKAGFGYKVGDVLSATVAGGTGFSITVATISNAREVYDPSISVDPLWNDFDISEIVYLCLKDIGIFLRDTETEQFAMVESKTGGI